MNVLTYTQPWATLVALGVKTIETRGWEPPVTAIGQPLAVHVGQSFPVHCRELVECKPFSTVLAAAKITLDDLMAVRGHVIATTKLEGARRMTKGWIEELQKKACTDHQTYLDLQFGNWQPGRVAWFLKKPVKLETPSFAKGALMIWTWDPDGCCCICGNPIPELEVRGALEDGGTACWPCWSKIPERADGGRKQRPDTKKKPPKKREKKVAPAPTPDPKTQGELF